MTMYHFFTALCLALLIACTPTEQNQAPTVSKTVSPAPIVQKTSNSYVSALEKAHQHQAFIAKKAIQFDIALTFGGKDYLNATITTLTNSTKARLDYKDGTTLIYNGNMVFAADTTNKAKKRFAAYTWPYFFLFPHKLSDEGTKWSAYKQNTLNGQPYLTQHLSFEAGTGDDPNDWYITYANPDNQLIEVAAYIVTSGKTKTEAEADPHAIAYSNYQAIDGIPIAHQWKFWVWRADEGLTKQLGEATLSNIRFVEPTPELFERPSTYVQL